MCVCKKVDSVCVHTCVRGGELCMCACVPMHVHVKGGGRLLQNSALPEPIREGQPPEPDQPLRELTTSLDLA